MNGGDGAVTRISGLLDIAGRGPSIWDEYTKKAGKIRDNSTADIAADSYHKIQEDITLLKTLGVSDYRFSLSWSRIFPKGTGKPNPKGVEHYHKVVDALLENGIEPMITLYHWDLPLALQDLGGWLNRDIIRWFRFYAVFCFREYGDKVKTWITINEPYVQVSFGYCGIFEEHAPGGFQEHCAWSQYLAGHHMILAHAHAYRAYHSLFRGHSDGKVGITNVHTWLEPASEAETEFAEQARDWTMRWFIHPFYEGDYPPAMRAAVNQKSVEEGRTTTRLPYFSGLERELLMGSFDFLGINYYYSNIVRRFAPEEQQDVQKRIDYDVDGIFWLSNEDMPVGDKNSWISNHPSGLRAVLNELRERYGNPEVFITENGCMDTPGEGLHDVTRMRYLRDHIAAVSQALEDGCDVVGYAVWSLMDNFEWSDGYSQLFGLHRVDVSSPSRQRTPKASAEFYAEIIRKNSVTLIEDCTWN
ncbi:unnamed protein product [Cylicocyclus nassatus]|uniref:Beta-glucosidase n=1 Tax=Cylicocyclus nassatus TaxID=53992 RepID=A0AA36DNJ8_CYLNA|nr:unnamed protein product [Cylicocyclus nassatus]